MIKPIRFFDPQVIAAIRSRFAPQPPQPGTTYATVRDFCESIDHLPKITGMDGDLKNVQRPWAMKALLQVLPPPARLLEIGGGEPVVSGALSELGYDVTLIDPYDGGGNGPTDYERYAAQFPHVQLVRAYFSPGMPQFTPDSYDAVFSVSVIEHLAPDALASCYRAITEVLRPGGISLHCFDFVLQGVGEEYDRTNARNILAQQANLGGAAADPTELDRVLRRLISDVETFYLSPQGHHLWRNGLPYEQFPFRKVVSIQTLAMRAA